MKTGLACTAFTQVSQATPAIRMAI